MKISVGCDHGALALKNKCAEHLRAQGHEVMYFGTHTLDSCDYPDIAEKVCDAIVNGDCDGGILVCGTGIGMSLAANKVKGIRAAACSEHFSAKYTRLHNDSNILCLGGRVIGPETAKIMVEAFVTTEFEGGRHQRRVDQIAAIENGEM